MWLRLRKSRFGWLRLEEIPIWVVAYQEMVPIWVRCVPFKWLRLRKSRCDSFDFLFSDASFFKIRVDTGSVWPER